MPPKGRTKDTTSGEVAVLLSKARAFVEVAELVRADERGSYQSVAGSLAVLAGIAAADAICGQVLKVRSAGRSHDDAVDLLEEVEPDGRALAKHLRDLISVKNRVQYAPATARAEDVVSMVRSAQHLVDAAHWRVQGGR